MVSSTFEIPTHAKGKIVIHATLLAATGYADRLQAYLAAVKKYALSEQEPGCLEYRVLRSFVTKGAVKFAVFEVYTGPDALAAHFASGPFKEMIAEIEEGTLASIAPQAEYYYEFE